MNRTFGIFIVLGLLDLTFAGCKKKTPAPVAEEQPPVAAPAMTEPRREAGNSPAEQKEDERIAHSPHSELAVANSDYEAWFRKYRLDLNDPKMLDADPDGDGFTNREEFLAGTDPLDPNSHPGVHTGMHMKEYTKVELPFVLRSVAGETAQIERTEGGEKRVEAVKAGQTLKNTPYRVTAVQSKQAFDKDGHPVDASHVTLENPANHQKVDLVKDLPTRSSASSAVLTSPDGTQTLTVHQGDTFSWPNEPGTHYVVKDLRDEQVILEQSETKQMWTVRKQ